MIAFFALIGFLHTALLGALAARWLWDRWQERARFSRIMARYGSSGPREEL